MEYRASAATSDIINLRVACPKKRSAELFKCIAGVLQVRATLHRVAIQTGAESSSRYSHKYIA